MVNLDYAASTPLRSEALKALQDYDAAPYAGANPNSLHSLGRQAACQLEAARRSVARSLGARVRPDELIFTGGGTEANLLALAGIAEGVRTRDGKRNRVVLSAIEHDSVLDNAAVLKRMGFSVTRVAPQRDGVVAPDALAKVLDEHVALVSCQIANNETGVVQPVKELVALAHGCGAKFHCDAIQGYLHIPFDVSVLGVDALSIAGHKVGAPVSIGALYLSARTPLTPQVYGGGQESGRRAGTQDVRSAMAFAAVAEALSLHVAQDRMRVQALSDKLYRDLLTCPSIHATMGDPFSVDRLPGIVSVYVEGAESEDLILKLDAAGFAVSAGSACSSASLDPSHVLSAMGLPRNKALGALRISFDDRVDSRDLDAFAEALCSLARA